MDDLCRTCGAYWACEHRAPDITQEELREALRALDAPPIFPPPEERPLADLAKDAVEGLIDYLDVRREAIRRHVRGLLG